MGSTGRRGGRRSRNWKNWAVQVARVLAQQIVAETLARQAAQSVPTADQTCPTCGQVGAPADPEPRTVTTPAGDAQWDEPERYCRRGRRSFFPPVQVPGT
ncbi:hypothetical protein [Fimbriiglobus ruber]|uniref:Uncharacterized protein n=1 Tax=Fimbriiglobus ruber TaxID=1908690 RepID=A0A225DAT2_9BACT|nr:hypothetical protein [Fimbriiglobus ruber]OWK34406.1 hypothetical protein FRUB_10377 [Fimbriiglobus ruber]